MGHVFNLDQRYLARIDDELRELYLKDMPNLTTPSGNGSMAVNRIAQLEAEWKEREGNLKKWKPGLTT